MRVFLLSAIMVQALVAVGQEPPATSSASQTASFTYANDFFTATDRYFTQGVGLRYGSLSLGTSWLAKPMLRLRTDPAPWLSVRLQQDCYTPSSIRTDTIRPLDQPFAAAIYLGLEATSLNALAGVKLSSSLIAGILGPCASCMEEQQWIHHGLGNIEPLGWQYQVHSDVLLNYGALLEKRLFNSNWAEGRGGLAAQVGTYRDDATASFTLELGKGASAFTPADQRPAKPRFSAFGNAAVTVVGYDAPLQGGMFQRDNPHVLPSDRIERVVAGYGWGARFNYKAVDLEYREWYIGRTFEGGLTHGWGTVVLRGWF
ncbi:MAG: lipid A-modifier LpxR family protein [Flavobacteriales bacterium]